MGLACDNGSVDVDQRQVGLYQFGAKCGIKMQDRRFGRPSRAKTTAQAQGAD